MGVMRVAVAALFGSAMSIEVDGPTKVEVLTADNFDDKVKEFSKGMLVEFYAPWCGHCKKLAPEYAKASVTLDEEGSPYKLGMVDATAHGELASKFGVQGYPTLKWFVDGADSEYDGGRTADEIVAWIKSVTGPAVTEGAAPEDAKTATVTWYGPELVEVFESAAKKYRKAAGWYWVKGSESKVVLKHVGEDAIEVTDSSVWSEVDAFTKWFDANSFPKFGALDGETFGKYSTRTGYGMIWGLFKMTADDVQDVVAEKRPMMTAVSEAVGDKFSVTWTNTNEFGSVMESMFGITEFPKIVVQKKGGDKKYWVYDGELTTEAIVEYATAVWNGEIPANLKSEAAPAEPQEDPVKVIVGSTLQEKVFTADKDVLLEVYAPWCGHCKKLEPEYVKVGKKVEREGFADKIVIAKMDGTLNDSPNDDISWTGFPTIVYVKAGSTEVTTFDGERTAKGIWKWIKKNSTYADEINAKIAAKKDEGGDKKEEL